MAAQNGTVNSVTLLSGNPSGIAFRKSYLIGVSFPAFNSGTPDTATVTGVLTAINNAIRDGKTRTLRAGATIGAGFDGTNPVFMTGGAVQALAVANATTTGDFTGSNQLSTEAGVIQTSAATTLDVQIVAVVDEG